MPKGGDRSGDGVVPINGKDLAVSKSRAQRRGIRKIASQRGFDRGLAAQISNREDCRRRTLEDLIPLYLDWQAALRLYEIVQHTSDMQCLLDRQLAAVLDLDPFDVEAMDAGYERLHRVVYPDRKRPERLVGRAVEQMDLLVD
jgi:hypothetical protein